MKKTVATILLGLTLSLAPAPAQSRSVDSPLIDPAAGNAARQQLTMTAHFPVPGAGVVIVKYPPGWVPQPGQGWIVIKSPDGFSTFEVGLPEVLGFFQSPDEVVQRIVLPVARRETPNLQIVQARTTPEATPIGPLREYVLAGTKQGRRFGSLLTVGINFSRPPMNGVPGMTTIILELFGGDP